MNRSTYRDDLADVLFGLSLWTLAATFAFGFSALWIMSTDLAWLAVRSAALTAVLAITYSAVRR